MANLTSKDIRDLIGALGVLANQLDGVSPPSDFDVNNKATWWPAMIKQAQDNTLPHPFIAFANGVLPDRAGTNEPISPFYEKFKTFWEAMQRQSVKDSHGEPFGQLNCIKRGGVADFEAEVKYLVKTPEGRAWFADPLNAYLLPKQADMFLLM